MSMNKNEIYESEIKPLVASIHKICKENEIPYFVATCTEINSNDEGTYIISTATPSSLKIGLRNDSIADCIKVFNGYIPTLCGATNESFSDSLDYEIQEDEVIDASLLGNNKA